MFPFACVDCTNRPPWLAVVGLKGSKDEALLCHAAVISYCHQNNIQEWRSRCRDDWLQPPVIPTGRVLKWLSMSSSAPSAKQCTSPVLGAIDWELLQPSWNMELFQPSQATAHHVILAAILSWRSWAAHGKSFQDSSNWNYTGTCNQSSL